MTNFLTREKLETLEAKLDTVLAIVEGNARREFLTVRETAKLLRISTSSVRDRTRNGKLPFSRLGNSETSVILIKRNDILKLLK